jgi:hypothetical protein
MPCRFTFFTARIGYDIEQFAKPYIKDLADKLEHLMAGSHQDFSAEQI